MISKRWWLGVLAIPLSLAVVFLTGAARPHFPVTSGPIDPTCTSLLPCIEYDNNSTGPGVRGVSLKGNGLAGWTDFNSTSSANGTAGLIGADKSATGAFDAGVRGVSVRGIGVSGQSTSGAGVQGNSKTSNGVFGDSQGSGASGVYGQNDGGGFGVAGRVTTPGFPAIFADAGSTGSIALDAESLSGVGANALGGHVDTITFHDFPALSIVGTTTISGGNTFINDLIDACPAGTVNPCYFSGTGPSSITVFRLEQTGDLVIAGRIFTSGSCHVGCAHINGSAEKRVRFYTPQESLPTVEDFGEAQLVNGKAYVRIDPTFANTIDPAAAYMVFITPEGDSRGLFVTAKTLIGFAVHENQGGRSTLAFSYRIIAKPFGEHPMRLQMFTMATPAAYPRQPTRIR